MKSVLCLTLMFLGIISYSQAQNSDLQPVSTTNAPKVIAPYSQAVIYANMVFCAGQIGISPTTNNLVGSDITSQAEQALKNIKGVLEASGSDLEHVVKVTVYLKDMKDYAVMNDIYQKYFTAIKPARSTVEVSRLPKDALIEIEVTGVKKN